MKFKSPFIVKVLQASIWWGWHLCWCQPLKIPQCIWQADRREQITVKMSAVCLCQHLCLGCPVLSIFDLLSLTHTCPSQFPFGVAFCSSECSGFILLKISTSSELSGDQDRVCKQSGQLNCQPGHIQSNGCWRELTGHNLRQIVVLMKNRTISEPLQINWRDNFGASQFMLHRIQTKSN